MHVNVCQAFFQKCSRRGNFPRPLRQSFSKSENVVRKSFTGNFHIFINGLFTHLFNFCYLFHIPGIFQSIDHLQCPQSPFPFQRSIFFTLRTVHRKGPFNHLERIRIFLYPLFGILDYRFRPLLPAVRLCSNPDISFIVL